MSERTNSIPETVKNTQKSKYISAAEATRKLQTKFPYLPDHIGCGFLRYMIPNIFTGSSTYFKVDRITDLMDRIKVPVKNTDKNIAVNLFINDVVKLKIDFESRRWYTVHDVALKVDSLSCNGKPHYGFESQNQVIDSVSNWLRAHQDKWFDENTDSFDRIDVPNNGKSVKILVRAGLMEKMFNAYIARDADTVNPFGNEPEVPVLTKSGLVTSKTCDDTVDGEPTLLLNVRDIKFPMKRSSCLDLLNRIFADEHIDSVPVKDGLNIPVSNAELKELAQSILKRL